MKLMFFVLLLPVSVFALGGVPCPIGNPLTDTLQDYLNKSEPCEMANGGLMKMTSYSSTYGDPANLIGVTFDVAQPEFSMAFGIPQGGPGKPGSVTLSYTYIQPPPPENTIWYFTLGSWEADGFVTVTFNYAFSGGGNLPPDGTMTCSGAFVQACLSPFPMDPGFVFVATVDMTVTSDSGIDRVLSGWSAAVPIPEPSAYMLTGLGLLLIGFWKRRPF
jgi:hypothetical protein